MLITGGTGLIGSILVKCLLALDVNVRITLPVRSTQKAKSIYERDIEKLDVVECDLLSWTSNLAGEYDYIIHCASPTAGNYMYEHPAETYHLAVSTTINLLEYARKNTIRGMVYISSLEYYGQSLTDDLITEDFIGDIDLKNPRNSYTMGKRAAEYACAMYGKEYSIPVSIARLTQTFGAGVSDSDNRVFAQFARSIIAGDNIVMHTTGDSAKPYLYTIDCVNAILLLLQQGEKGDAYNVANEDTYISIKDMALWLKENFNPAVKIVTEVHPEMKYAEVTKLHLSTKKLRNLGWRARYNLIDMFDRLIRSIK